MDNSVIHGDCLDAMKSIEDNSIDLVYLDPPFYTQKAHKLADRQGKNSYEFSDIWKCNSDYALFLRNRLIECKRVLKNTGSIFVHCDNKASHLIRFIMDEVMGEENFRSKIIWTYKRWSNSKKGLLPSYQEIFFYSKTDNFKFSKVYTDYSPTTNIDQILQKRTRDDRGKAVYAKNDEGEIVAHGAKVGVPLNDVWDLPYLNPKANERVGYPTQKPIILLERIISLCTQENDVVLDPFCGSGTTLVAAKLLNRVYIGIDVSVDAINLSKERINKPIKTHSTLLAKGKDSYINTGNPLSQYLEEGSFNIVHRNKGIDGILKNDINGKPVLVKVQKKYESLTEAASALVQAAKSKCSPFMILIITQPDVLKDTVYSLYPNVHFIKSAEMQIRDIVRTNNKQQEIIVV